MKKSILLFLVAIVPMLSFSQRYIGIATSNWSATNGLYLNPANIADSRTKFSIDLFSLNAGAEFNAGLNFKGSEAIDFFQGTDSTKNFQDIFDVKKSKNGEYRLLFPYVEMRGPGAMISLNRKHSIAVTTRARVMHQVHNVNESFFTLLTDSVFDNPTTTFQSKNLNWTAHAWAEVGFSYGGVIWEKEKHQLKGGVTLRYLKGAGYAGVISKNLEGEIKANDSDAVLTISNSDFSFAQGGLFSGNSDFSLSDILGGNSGSGFGADLGLVYEYRPDYEKYKYDLDGKKGEWDNSANKYKLRFSAALTDLGSIKYKNGNRVFNASNTGSSSSIQGSELFDKIGDFDSVRTYLATKGINVSDTTKPGEVIKVGLPRMLVLGVDYHAVKNFYINAMLMANMANHGTRGNAHYSQITVTPRWDTRVFSVGLPITYSMLSSKLRVGAGLRVGGLILGSDDMLSLFSSTKYGSNFYFGLSVPINKRRPKDSDADGISNRKDKCPNEKGVAEMEGCPNPDKDGDGILDKDDKCPDVAGSKTANGCPDSDLDSVANAEDRCPQEAGPVAMQGCPDRDKDKIADIDDVCPDLAGLAQYKGCPDSDNDGIADNEDQCPKDAGPKANNGCPDSDNDGIPDQDDKCPKVAGKKENNGCPVVSIEVKKRLAFAATAIQFDLGKASIKPASNKLLDEVVKILNDYPDYDMTIEGHTDNVGKPDKNMQLSKDRAEAVRNYFISQGIASSRLSSEGYGDTKPVEDNKTAAGRAKNRRVAMDLKLR